MQVITRKKQTDLEQRLNELKERIECGQDITKNEAYEIDSEIQSYLKKIGKDVGVNKECRFTKRLVQRICKTKSINKQGDTQEARIRKVISAYKTAYEKTKDSWMTCRVMMAIHGPRTAQLYNIRIETDIASGWVEFDLA